MTLYVLTFNDSFATREKITAYLDNRKDIVSDWYYCLTNAIFIASSASAKQLTEVLLGLSKTGRFLVSEIKSIPCNDGWLPQNAWDFINKYAR